MQQLVAQRDAELANKELTEQMKIAITEKYNKLIDKLTDERLKKEANAIKEAISLDMENALLQMQVDGASTLDILNEKVRISLETFNNVRREDYDSEEKYLNDKLKAQVSYLQSKKAITEEEVNIATKKMEVLSSLAGSLSELVEQAAGDNENMAQLAKILAIAEVSIAQGVAIAKAVETATRSSATWIDMLAAIGTVVASVTTVMGKAMKSVKSAKFAQGGKVEGPGSGISDSIPAMLSNGESVMTAATTSMFAPLLSAFNQIGGGIPINVTASSNQALGEDMLAKAVAKGMMMAPAPVVSVEEFTSVANRVKYVENLGSI